MNEDIIGLFDMDGTLFDYTGKLREDLRPLMGPNEEEPENLWDESLPHIKARMDLIKSIPGWWRNLPKLEAGWEVLAVAKDIGFKIKILTKGPAKKPLAWAEKVECIRQWLGDCPIDIAGEDKTGQYGRFLCDDYPPYLLGWLKYRPRGLGILIENETNKDFTHDQVLHYNGKNLEEIKEALRAVYARKPGDHWK